MTGKNTEICAYEKYLYFKSEADIAMFMIKDAGDNPYALSGVISMANGHSRASKITALPKDVLEILDVFDVANQGEEPFVYITKTKPEVSASVQKQRRIKALCRARWKENLRI